MWTRIITIVKENKKISKQFKTLGIWFEITWNLFHLLINSHSTRANSKTKFTMKSVAHEHDDTTCTCSTHFYWILLGKWPAYNYMLAQKYSRCLYMYVKYIRYNLYYIFVIMLCLSVFTFNMKYMNFVEHVYVTSNQV